MKKDTLYTISRFNYPAFMPQHVFSGGGTAEHWQLLADQDRKANPWNYVDDGGSTLSQYQNSKGNNWFGISKKDNPFSKGNIKGTVNGMATAIAAPVGEMAEKAISGGFKSGAGSAISNIGGAVGTGLMAVNPAIGAAALVGSKIIGGLTTRAFGMKTNTKALNAANAAINQNRSFVSNADSYDDLPTLTATANFKNPYTGGWLVKGKAKRKNQKLKNNFLEAKSFATRSIDNNVSNIADDQMNNMLANYAAYGGPLEMMATDGNMGAIGYGLMSDYLTMKNNQVQNKGNMIGYMGALPSEPMTFAKGGGIHIKKSHEGLFTEQAKMAGMGVQEYASHVLANKDKYPVSTVRRANFARNASHWHSNGGVLDAPTFFALGGDMQTNGSDWSTGLSHIDEGQRHEENPYGGVQLGLAPDNTPNLVEENETIFNDYVFSNRIKPKKEVLRKFHMSSKNSKLTYADVSKKLEKEAKERPNDPVSQASLKKMLEQLAEAQEQQKAEEEAERARKAFEALSPEEQQQVLAQIAQQQSVEQEETAAQQQQAEQEIPVDENGNPIVGSAAAEQPPVEEIPQGVQEYADGGQLNTGHKYDGNTETSQQMRRRKVGTWKNPDENHWGKYVMPTLLEYLQNVKARLDMAPDEATQRAIREEAINNYNRLQQSYYDNVVPTLGKSQYDYNDGILNHQQYFDSLGGNHNFYTTDDMGNTVNLIAQDLNLPEGASTEDKPTHWYDGYNGPQTSLRNFGSTEYGDNKYYADIVKTAQDLGIALAPNDNWKYGDHDSNRLYSMSLLDNSTSAESPVKKWDWSKGDWTDEASEESVAPVTPAPPKKDDDNVKKLDYLPTMSGIGAIFPQIAGLGLWATGVGKPDTSQLDAAVENAGNVAFAGYKPIGNYLTYRPMDIWAAQNRADANSRAVDRAIRNSSSPIGTKMAGLLANSYNSQLANAGLFRQALEYNDAQKQKVADFNRGTDIQNANAYNQVSQFNADALNKNRQYRASLAAQVAAQKLEADNAWDSAPYQYLTAIGNTLNNRDLQNRRSNMLIGMANAGLVGVPTEELGIITSGGSRAKGGKLNKKKGLTF